MVAYFRQEKCFEALSPQVPTRVFVEPEEDLGRQFAHVVGENAQGAWELIIDNIALPYRRARCHVQEPKRNVGRFISVLYNLSRSREGSLGIGVANS